MNIAFLDFWQYPKPFDPNNNFLTNMLRMSTDINIVNPNHAELIIYSCFGNENKRYSHCKKIFYTGECITPDFNQCDYSISFDFDSYDNRNIRIPLWYFYIDWFSMKTYGNPDYLIPIDYLTGENEFTKKEKSKFCSAVFSQSRDIRFDFVNRLKSYKDVDCYGKIHKNSLPDGERYKMDIISDYKFNMCFENTIFPGYFTEKLLHAKIAGCVPLYYSDKSYSTDFNSKCCINLIEFENQDTFIEYIKEIDSDYSLYQKLAKEPLFESIPDLSDLVKSLSKIIEI
jgi:hypothetical protein